MSVFKKILEKNRGENTARDYITKFLKYDSVYAEL